MNLPDGFRAQYYLRKLLEFQSKIDEALKSFKCDVPREQISLNICEQLALSLDQLILPTIVKEIVNVDDSGDLVGNTGEERYKSFFLNGENGWTDVAKSIPLKYPFLFEMMDILISSTTNNLLLAMSRLKNDLGHLQNAMLLFDTLLSEVKFGVSDRHMGGQQAIIFRFGDDRVVYKPVDLTPNTLYEQFIEMLELQKPYDLKAPKTLSRDNYGWVEYVRPDTCADIDSLKRYYKRAGVVLAIADALNYCDGHMENLIASGEYPVLIDLETLFHAFGKIEPELGERSVLFTGLIEKPPEDEADKGFTAAFQAISANKYELLYPYAVNDHTDQITVRYRGFSSVLANNSPIMGGVAYTPMSFIDDFVEGFAHCYNVITQNVSKWLRTDTWWNDAANVRARQLVRHTMYYELISRKIQQPDRSLARMFSEQLVRELLESDQKHLVDLTPYEVESILSMDIPFFYHFPNSLDLYDSLGHCYKNYFEVSAIAEMHEAVKNRSLEYMERNIEIIRNVLNASPEPLAI